ncbi:MAG TPA: Rieske 2Fe-2S domain-containing protein [Mycobacteriales bacterium]
MQVGPQFVRALERVEGLDAVAQPLVSLVGRVVRPRVVRNVLSGTPIGHAAHPLLTDLPIGAWTASALLDAVGGSASEPAADLLVKAGLLAAVPTAATGLNDWSDTQGAETRVGLVHAAANTAALVVYLMSWRARAHGHRSRGKALGLLGLGAVTVGGYLGGHLAFAKGVNVNRAAWDEGLSDWTPVLADADLADGEHRTVDAGGTTVLLVRSGATVSAIANTCTHMGGPLDEGTIADGCVTCPWHGSVFRLRDGGIERGPACVTQPTFQTRIHDNQIELRS